MWALGVIVFVMVSGQLPFWHEKDKVVQNKIKMIDYEFEGDVWNNVSKQCKDWISKNLIQANKRMNVHQALHHCWLDECGAKIYHK